MGVGEEENDSYWVRKGDIICVLYTVAVVVNSSLLSTT